MADTTNNTPAEVQGTVVTTPQAGGISRHTPQEGQVYQLDFDLADKTAILTGSDLRVEMDDGAVLIFEEFATADSQGNVPLFVMEDGSVIPGDILLALLSGEPTEEVAAGEEPQGGGVGEWGDGSGEGLSGIDKLGVQDPDAFLAAQAGTLEDEQTPLELPQNQPPDAIDDMATVGNEDESITFGVLPNDSDPDGDPIDVVSYTPHEPPKGILTFDPDTNEFTFDPNGEFEELDDGETEQVTFTYTIEDPDGASDTATVTITVNGANDAPIAVDNQYQVSENGILSGGDIIDDLGDDPDFADPTADFDVDVEPLTVYEVDGETANVGDAITLSSGALLTVNADGTFSYDPNGQFNDLGNNDTATDSFTYKVTDGDAQSNIATVTITINGTEDPPTLKEATDATVSEEGLVDDDTTTQDDLPTGEDDTNSATDTTGSFTITDIDTTYTVEDFALDATDGSIETADGDAVNFDWSDADNALIGTRDGTTEEVIRIHVDSVTKNGDDYEVDYTVTLSQPVEHPFNGDGAALTYDESPAAEEDEDEVSFDVDVTAGSTTFADAFSVTVEDDSPIAGDDSYGVAEDGTLNASSVLADDSVGGDGGLTIVSNTDVSNGTLSFNSTDGTFTYTPDANYNGPDSFTYTIEDADGDQAAATVSITVRPVDDPPTLKEADDATVSEEGLVGAATQDDLPTGEDDTNSATDTTGSFTITDIDTTYTVEDFALDATDGSIETADGDAVNFDWSDADNALIGTRDGTTEEVIRIHVDSVTKNGDDYEVDYTVTLSQPVEHPFNGDGAALAYDESPAAEEDEDEVSFDVDVTAGSTTFADAFSVTVEDDSPIAIDPDSAYLVNNIGEDAMEIPLDLDINVDNNYGGDGASVQFVISDPLSGYTTNGEDIYLYTDGSHLIGSTLASSDYATASADLGSTGAFIVTLNTDGDLALANDTYDFELLKQIDGGSGDFNTNTGTWDFEGGNTNYVYYTDASGNDLPSVMLTPIGADGDKINATATEAGVDGGGGGQDIMDGEGVRVDFLDTVTGTPIQDSYLTGPAPDHSFDQHVLVNGAEATFAMNKTKTTTVLIEAFIDADYTGSPDEPDDVGDYSATVAEITSIEINNVEVLEGGSIPAGYTVDFSGDGVVVGGVSDGDSIVVFTDNDFTTVEYSYVEGTSFSMSGFGASAYTPGELVDMNFDLEITDTDGDSTFVEDGIRVLLSPDDHVILTGDDSDNTISAVADQASTIIGGDGSDTLTGDTGNDILIGGDGEDFLVGGDGNDLLYGGLGDDDLTGGNGADVFGYTQGINEGGDTITDFDLGDDALRFYDVLDTEESDFMDNVIITADSGANDHVTLTLENGSGTSIVIEDINTSGTFDGYNGQTLSDLQGGVDAINIEFDPDNFAS